MKNWDLKKDSTVTKISFEDFYIFIVRDFYTVRRRSYFRYRRPKWVESFLSECGLFEKCIESPFTEKQKSKIIKEDLVCFRFLLPTSGQRYFKNSRCNTSL